MNKSNTRVKLVVLISGEGSNLQAFIDKIAANALNAEIVAVISNKASANGLNRAHRARIPTVVVQPIKNQSRDQFDQRLIEAISPLTPDFIILAGFMRILTAKFVQTFAGKIINIHPSLLPDYKGLNTHQRVIDAGERYHGATVHYVTEELDAGEIIIQSRIKILPEDDAHSLQQRVHREEHVIYPRAIEWLATHS